MVLGAFQSHIRAGDTEAIQDRLCRFDPLTAECVAGQPTQKWNLLPCDLPDRGHQPLATDRDRCRGVDLTHQWLRCELVEDACQISR